MQITMIGSRRVFPEPEAGLDFYARELAGHLKSQGHFVEILCHPHWCPKVHHLDTFVYSAWASLKAVRMKSILHYHGGSALFAWIPKLFGKKIIVTVHSREWCSQHIPKHLRLFYFLGEWLGIKAADSVSCVSQTLQKELQKRFSKKIFYTPLGFSIPQSQGSQALLSTGLTPKNYLLFLGRLETGKGVEDLLKAFHTIHQHIPYSLVIAGEPLYDHHYFEKLKNLAGPKVIFLGKVTGTLKDELLANALLYVQASQAEGLSLSLLEAMSYGTPVLVSDIEQNKEAVGSAGFFFKNQDAQDLQSKLKKLLSSDTKYLEQMGRKARQKIETEHSWEGLKQRIQEVYSL